MRQFQPRLFSLEVEVPHVGVSAGSGAFCAFDSVLIAICNFQAEIGQHGAHSISAALTSSVSRKPRLIE
jgi:hypothetical protein